MDNWNEIRDLWLEVREFKWKCNNIPEWARGKIWALVKLYKAHFPNAYVHTSACKLPGTINTIGKTLAGMGLIEGELIFKQ